MLPSEWGEVFEVLVGDVVSPAPELFDCPLYVDSVPERNRGAQNIEAAGPVHLVFIGAVAHLTETIEEDCPCESIPCFSLVETGR